MQHKVPVPERSWLRINKIPAKCHRWCRLYVVCRTHFVSRAFVRLPAEWYVLATRNVLTWMCGPMGVHARAGRGVCVVEWMSGSKGALGGALMKWYRLATLIEPSSRTKSDNVDAHGVSSYDFLGSFFLSFCQSTLSRTFYRCIIISRWSSNSARCSACSWCAQNPFK